MDTETNAGARDETPSPYGSEPFFPHHALRQGIQLVLLLAALVALASLFPPPMHPNADPFDTPARVRPEWYLLAPYQILKVADALSRGAWSPKAIAMLVMVFLLTALWFLPFWDRGEERHPSRRPLAVRIGIAVSVLYLLFTTWGYFS